MATEYESWKSLAASQALPGSNTQYLAFSAQLCGVAGLSTRRLAQVSLIEWKLSWQVCWLYCVREMCQCLLRTWSAGHCHVSSEMDFHRLGCSSSLTPRSQVPCEVVLPAFKTFCFSLSGPFFLCCSLFSFPCLSSHGFFSPRPSAPSLTPTCSLPPVSPALSCFLSSLPQ